MRERGNIKKGGREERGERTRIKERVKGEKITAREGLTAAIGSRESGSE